MTADADTSRAHRAAAELVIDHGVPWDFEGAVKLVALAYMRGSLDARMAVNEELRTALNGDVEAAKQ